MQAASSSGRALLCDQATQLAVSQTRPQQGWRAGATLSVKGFAQPVPTYEPLDSSSALDSTRASSVADPRESSVLSQIADDEPLGGISSESVVQRELTGREDEMRALEETLGRLEQVLLPSLPLRRHLPGFCVRRCTVQT